MSNDDARPGADIFEGIGLVAATSSVLESAVLNLHEMLLASPRGHKVVAGEQFAVAYQAILHLSSDLDEDLRARVKAAATSAHEAWNKRGKVIHGKWHLGSHGEVEPGRSALVSNRKRGGTQLAIWSAAKLLKLNCELIEATREVQAVTLEVYKTDNLIK